MFTEMFTEGQAAQCHARPLGVAASRGVAAVAPLCALLCSSTYGDIT